jgi:hypothetical protein
MTRTRKRQFALAAVAIVALQIAASAHATNSKAELAAVMRDLLAWLPGEYDTLPQVDLERRLGAPPDGEHDRQYRVFTRVEVPHIAPVVMYGEVHVTDKRGPIIPGQQVLYIVSMDEARGAVVVNGRRIKDGPNHRYADWTPDNIKTMALDEDFGGNCDFLWRRHGEHLVGKLANSGANNDTCTMVSKRSGQKMTWDAEWLLTPQQLWVFDNGYLIDQQDPTKPPRFFAGREDLTHERLYKGRYFRCSAGAAGSARVYDAGEEWKPAGSELTLRLLRGQYPRADNTGLEERLSLSVFKETDSEPLAQQFAKTLAGPVSVVYQGLKVNCRAER